MTRDKVELTANISVIVSAVLFCFVFLSNYILPSHTGEKHQVTGRAEGTTLKLDGVKWQDHKQSLVMAISTHCSYCIRSIPFYQRLLRNKFTTISSQCNPHCCATRQPDILEKFFE